MPKEGSHVAIPDGGPSSSRRRRARPANAPVNALGRMMVKRHMIPADLAALSGISGRKLYSLLNNKPGAVMTNIDKVNLARVLNCTIADISGD